MSLGQVERSEHSYHFEPETEVLLVVGKQYNSESAGGTTLGIDQQIASRVRVEFVEQGISNICG